jgi:DNA-binding response OmpR family regulator
LQRRPPARVLLIDDDAELLMLLRRAFQAAGYVVGHAANGEEGLDRFRREPADLVVTDIFMPRRDGIETILALRLLDPLVRIIAIGGARGASPHDCLDLAWQLGANETVAKPFGPSDILQAAERVLSRQPEDR